MLFTLQGPAITTFLTTLVRSLLHNPGNEGGPLAPVKAYRFAEGSSPRFDSKD